MDALLLALLIGLALDQGDRSQRLMHVLEGRGLLAVGLVILLAAFACAMLGVALTPYLHGRAGLLFFAAALVTGALGLLFSGRSKPVAANGGRAALYLQLLLHRLSDRSAFLIVGVAAMTGNLWASAAGAVLGGFGALLPTLLAGHIYERAVRLRLLAPMLGAMLMLAGFGSGLGALGLL